MDISSKRRDLILSLGLAGLAGSALTSAATAQANGIAVNPIARRPDATPDIPPAAEPADQKLAAAAADQPQFDRDDGNAKAWDQLKKILSTEYLPTEDGTIVAKLRDLFSRIENGFVFAAEKQDQDFSALHIEPLLDQAADLLDRGIRDRAAYEDIAKKFFELMLEIGEYAELDSIHKEEEKAGVYEVQARFSSGEFQAEQQRQQGSTNIRNHWSWYRLSNLSPAKQNEQSYAAQITGALSYLVPYVWQGQSFAGYQQHTWLGNAKFAYQHGLESAYTLSSQSIDYALTSTAVQEREADYAAMVAKMRANGLLYQSNWDTANIRFQKLRTLAARKFQDMKAKAALQPDGVLNQGKRLPAIRRRFHQDFRNALARLSAIRPGLVDIYGYREAFPANDKDLEYFDDCLHWTRDAIDWVIRFSRQDQSLVIPVSIRQIMGDRAWREGRRIGKWTFAVDAKLFTKMAHVRLRGLSAFSVDGVSDTRFWGLIAHPPKTSSIRHLDGHVAKLDQSKVPAIRFGRVSTREAVRDPDILGISALHNASPVGQWTLEIVSKFPVDVSFDTISDIHIDLHVAYRASA